MSRVARVAVLALVVGMTAGASVSVAETHGPVRGRFDEPQTGYMRAVLQDGSPRSVGLDPGPIDAAIAKIDEWTTKNYNPSLKVPLYSGAVSVLAHDGVVVNRHNVGYAVRYADGAGTELPEDQKVPMRPDTIFDMASVSKLLTSVAVMQLVESGKVDTEEPVATYVPEFGVNGKDGITVRQLLTHSSGLVSWLPLWSAYPDVPARVKAMMDVAPHNTPGTVYEYSDLNLITLGVLIERITGEKLDKVV